MVECSEYPGVLAHARVVVGLSWEAFEFLAVMSKSRIACSKNL